MFIFRHGGICFGGTRGAFCLIQLAVHSASNMTCKPIKWVDVELD